MPVIPEVQRLRLEEPEFKASLGYVMTVSKQTNKAKRNNKIECRAILGPGRGHQ
jgi:hypothetical protein